MLVFRFTDSDQKLADEHVLLVRWFWAPLIVFVVKIAKEVKKPPIKQNATAGAKCWLIASGLLHVNYFFKKIYNTIDSH